ncbi:glycosyltransferase family 4 protein [Vibrio splendidus]|uniref:glycosyltransferase family 4 protein n=1 Tax=Vibrio splendidus TaxID=29497 RepID=UPI0002EA0B72|nr:glycosyltransferase family 4 protein [Vibrio splendidus]
MKILIVSHEYPPRLGGAGVVAKGMSECLSESNEVEIIHTSKIVKYQIFHKLWFLLYPFLFVVKYKKLSKYDLIILNDPAVQYAAGLLFNEKLLGNSICIMHGPERNVRPESNIIVKIINFKKFYFRATNKCRNKIYVSNNLKINSECLMSEYDKKNASVIYNGIEVDVVKLVNSKKNGIIKNKNTIITVSRIEKSKGLDNVLDIYMEMKKIIPEIKWSVIGDGSYLSEFKDKVNDLGLNNSVSFKGKKTRTEVINEYLTHEYFIHLPEWEEPFGLTLLESELCGCKIITNNRGGIPEVLKIIKSSVFCIVDEKYHLEELENYMLNSAYPDINLKVRSQKEFCNELLITYINGSRS